MKQMFQGYSVLNLIFSAVNLVHSAVILFFKGGRCTLISKICRSGSGLWISRHQLTESLPKREGYGFTSQIRRSSLSIPANIAEAFGRKHILEKINFYVIAKGSLTETLSHLEYGRRVQYFANDQARPLESTLSDIANELNKIVLSLQRARSRAVSRP